MQVGNIYVDLEIPDLEMKDFLQVTDCYALEIVETSGTSLPTALMVIKTSEDKVINGINENTSAIVKIGNSPEDCDSFTMYPQIIKPHRNSEEKACVIEFGGFIGDREYEINQRSIAHTGNSLEVLKKVFNNMSAIETNIDRVNDQSVTWRQVNETDCQFAINTLLHMDIRPSFPLIGIDKNLKVYIKDFEKSCKEDIKKYFVPYTPSKSNCYQYINNFNIQTYKAAYDLFSGFNRNVQVHNSETGVTKNVINPNTPIVASSQISERSESGMNQTLNQVQSPNVHGTYTESYIYNTNKLVSLSSLVGEILVPGYIRDIAPTDMVYVVDNGDVGQPLTGRYVVDTISTMVNFSSGMVLTNFYVTRDNKNNVENYVNQKKGLKIKIGLLQEVADAVGSLRVAYAVCQEIMDGTYLNRLMSFGIAAKNNILRSFSVAGTTIDFTSQANALQSFVLLGNSLMNTLTDMIFPSGIAAVLRDFIILKPTMIGLIGGFISQYVPSELQDIIMRLFESTYRVTNSLNSIAKDNGIKVSTTTVVNDTGVSTQISTIADVNAVVDNNGEITLVSTSYNAEEQAQNEINDKINSIIADFESETIGLDIPFPVIDLSESQSLYSDDALKDYVVNKTLDNLTDLGYIDNEFDLEALRKVLMGEEEITSDLIERINETAGSAFNYRFWGTFGGTNEAFYAWKYEDLYIYTKKEEITNKTRLYNQDKSPYVGTNFAIAFNSDDRKYEIQYDGEPVERDPSEDIITNALIELTSFKIKKGYKDKYRTVPCTKMINALGNERIYFACPKRELNLSFYINSKKVVLPYFELDLDVTNALGDSIPYNVYYTEGGYNSSSVLFEVRKGV